MPTTGIVHQIDLCHPVSGGIDSCIEGILRYAPATETLVLIGADRSTSGSVALGQISWHALYGRTVGFLPVVRLGSEGRSGWMPETIRMVAGLLRFRRVVRQSVDILQVHRSETGAILSMILGALPRVQCIHGDNDRSLRHPSVSYWRFMRGLHLAVERWSIKRACRTFVFSKSGAARLARFSSRVSYLSSWYDPALVVVRTGPRPDEDVLVLWVGRFEEEKDPLLALDTLRRFAGEGPHRRGIMVGDGTLHRVVREAASGSATVTLTGRVPPSEVAQTMADADVLLMTSRFEGSPVVMNEALAAGTPVVCTEASDPDERIEDGRNGLRVAERSAAALAAALTEALAISRTECVASARGLAAPDLVSRLFAPAISRADSA